MSQEMDDDQTFALYCSRESIQISLLLRLLGSIWPMSVNGCTTDPGITGALTTQHRPEDSSLNGVPKTRRPD